MSFVPPSAGSSLLSFAQSLAEDPHNDDGMGSVRQSKKNSAVSVQPAMIDPETEMAAWFVCGMPRAEVRKMASELASEGVTGNFLIRDVKTEPDCYGLTVRMDGGRLTNYLIDKTKDSQPQFFIRGTKRRFDTLSELVEYYSIESRPSLGVKLVPPVFDDYLDVDDNEQGDARGNPWQNGHAGTHASDEDEIRWAQNAFREQQRHIKGHGGRGAKNRPYRGMGMDHDIPDDELEHRKRMRLRAAEAQIALIRQETALAQARLKAAEAALKALKSKPKEKKPKKHKKKKKRKSKDEERNGSEFGSQDEEELGVVTISSNMVVNTEDGHSVSTALMRQAAARSLRGSAADLSRFSGEDSPTHSAGGGGAISAPPGDAETSRSARALDMGFPGTTPDPSEEERRAHLAAVAKSQLSMEMSKDPRVAAMLAAQHPSSRHSSPSHDGQSSLPSSNNASRPESVNVDAMLQQAIRKEQEKMGNWRRQVSATEESSGADENGQKRVRFAENVVGEAEPTVAHSADQNVPDPDEVKRRMSFKLDRSLHAKELAKLEALEQEEQQRRRQFDEEIRRLYEAADKLRGSRYHQEVNRLHKMEVEEKVRREDWDTQKEEREVRVLMNRPDGTQDLEEYLLEEAQRYRQKESKREKLASQMKEVVPSGAVKKFAEKFQS